MKAIKHSKGLLRWAITLASLCAALWLTTVESASLNLDTSIGFSNTIRLGRWAPVTVTIENTGELFKGRIELEVTAGDELDGTVFDYTWQREFELTRGARKRFQFTVYIDNFANPVQVRIVSEGKIAAHQQIDLRQRFTDSRLVVVLSRNADLDYLNESANGRIRVTYPHPGMLPEQWQGYDGVAAVIVHGVTLNHWSEQQYEALKKWLAQGGRLIISGGPDYTSLRTERLAALLPAMPTGLITVENDAEFRAALGESFVAPRPFQLHRVVNNAGRVTLSAAQHPLAIESEYGSGRVSYLLFDIGAYPFADWTGMGKLWRRTLDWVQAEVERPLPTLKSSAVPEIFKLSHRRFPERKIAFGFLLAYLGALSAFYLKASRDKAFRQPVTWMVPVVFIPVTYLLFVSFLSPAGVSAVAVSVVEPLKNGPYAKRNLDIGMSSNRAELSALEIESTTAVLLPRVDENQPDRTAHWLQRIAQPHRLEVVKQPPNIMHTLWGLDLVDLAFELTVQQTDVGLHVNVHNVSQLPLAFAWLVFDSWLYPLGSISTAVTSDTQIDSREVVAVNNVSVLDKHFKGGEQQLAAAKSALLHTVRNFRKKTPLQQHEALFVALMEPMWSVVRSDASVQVTEIELLLSKVNVQLLPSNPADHTEARPHAK